MERGMDRIDVFQDWGMKRVPVNAVLHILVP